MKQPAWYLVGLCLAAANDCPPSDAECYPAPPAHNPVLLQKTSKDFAVQESKLSIAKTAAKKWGVNFLRSRRKNHSSIRNIANPYWNVADPYTVTIEYFNDSNCSVKTAGLRAMEKLVFTWVRNTSCFHEEYHPFNGPEHGEIFVNFEGTDWNGWNFDGEWTAHKFNCSTPEFASGNHFYLFDLITCPKWVDYQGGCLSCPDEWEIDKVFNHSNMSINADICGVRQGAPANFVKISHPTNWGSQLCDAEHNEDFIYDD